ncbi:ABC transporter permease [Gordonia hongkongensis]|uniref:ABC transporter permease n=1 Tax=Gordonia hongkongensis TaxID=1701090 RepID=UPI003EBD1273
MSRELFSYAARRLAIMAGLLLVVSFTVFSLVYLAPGDPLDVLLGGQPSTPETVAALEREYSLDQPYLVQYWAWLSDALRLDLGESITSQLPVTEALSTALPTTLFLGVYAYALTLVFGVGFGALAALRPGSWWDQTITGGSVIGLSMPAFVSGTLLLYVFAVQLNWFPASGRGTGFLDQIWHLTLPAFALAALATGYVVKHTRSAMLEVLDQDYITFARARGLSTWRVLTRYALRNSLIPVITISGIILGFVITGAVLVEIAFSLPGIGSLMMNAASSKDVTTIQGVALVIAFVIMAANLIADITYALADPRVRLGKAAR